jgi:hypothetical protein
MQRHRIRRRMDSWATDVRHRPASDQWLNLTRRTAHTVTTDGNDTMDIRFDVFNLIFRDALLRALLVNHANRIDNVLAPERAGTGTCFVALRWADNDGARAAAGSQLLTAQAHMPRHRSDDHVYLDVVLERLRAALPVGASSDSFTIRCRESSPEVMDSGAGTIFKTTTFEIAPASPEQVGRILLDLPPWTARAEALAAGLTTPGGLVAAGAGSPGLN